MGDFMWEFFPPAWPQELLILSVEVRCGREVPVGDIGGHSVERDEVTQWNVQLDIHASLQTGLVGSCHNSSGLRLWGKGTGFRVSPGHHSAVSTKMKNTSAGTRLRVFNPTYCSVTLILSMPYLLTLLAIMEKLYCAVLSLSSNSLVAMVPSVPSIVK